MKKKQYTLRKKVQYELDDFISKGLWAQLALLVGCVLVLMVGFGFIIWYVFEEETMGSSLWQSLMHIIDQGTITGDDTSDPKYLLVMLFITVVGMAFTSTIIGIIGNAIQQKINELNKGHSRIIEKGHVVVLGYNENTNIICREIEDCNCKKKGNHIVVVVGDLSKEEMEHTSKEDKWSRRKVGEDEAAVIEKEKKTKTLFRSGDLVSENTFSMCAVDRARSIIVNGNDDFETIRILLALVAFLKKQGAYIGNVKMPSVVALIRRKKNLDAARIAAGVMHEKGVAEVKKINEHKVRILYFKEIMSRLFAQVCVQPGLSLVMSNLINLNNASFYIEDIDKDENIELRKMLLGKNLVEITKLVHGAIPIGFANTDDKLNNHIDLNPDISIPYTSNDRLVYLADDEDSISLKECKEVSPIATKAIENNKPESATRHFLIVGWNSSLPGLIKNMSDYCDGGSSIDIITQVESECDDDTETLDMRNTIIDNPYNWENLKKHLESHPYWFDINDDRHITNIVIVNEDGIDIKGADEKVMILLINLREYIHKICDYNISITTEVKDPQNQVLVQSMSINDYVVGTQIANKFIVQMAEDPKKYYIFEELLRQRGEVVVLKPFSEYIDTTKPFNYEGICREVINKSERTGNQEIVLGWIELYNEMDTNHKKTDPEHGLVLNPSLEMRNEIFTDDGGNNFVDYRLVILCHGMNK